MVRLSLVELRTILIHPPVFANSSIEKRATIPLAESTAALSSLQSFDRLGLDVRQFIAFLKCQNWGGA